MPKGIFMGGYRGRVFSHLYISTSFILEYIWELTVCLFFLENPLNMSTVLLLHSRADYA